VLADPGGEAWYGPFDERSGVTTGLLRRALRTIGGRTSIRSAMTALDALRRHAPAACSLVDGALWDAIGRADGVPVWRLCSDQGSSPAPFYASALGLDPRDVVPLLEIALSCHPVAKCSAATGPRLAEQLAIIRDGGLAPGTVALDAHGGLSLDDIRRVPDLRTSVAWLEDPFPVARGQWWAALDRGAGTDPPPFIVAGENMTSERALLRLARRSAVARIHIEVERVGFTRSLFLLDRLQEQGRSCLLHGRMPIPCVHLGIIFRQAVDGVEWNLAFACERVASLAQAGEGDARALVDLRARLPGFGSAPSSRARLVNTERLL
jgi:L-alanine-DL-glutamate epimerase-like enolase superfamily enzyme